MGNRVTFLAGFAAGFVVGTRAGRERYEQMVKLSRKAVEHPAVQQAGRTAGSKASDLTQAARQMATDRFPKIAETAGISTSRTKTGASTASSGTGTAGTGTAGTGTAGTGTVGAGTVGAPVNQTPDRTSGDDVSPAGNGNRPDE